MNSILDCIGNTPLVKTRSVGNNWDSELWLKLEGHNPGASIKDRAAYNMISKALSRSDIRVGDHLVEATSGNTGIALAYISNLLGLKMTLVMPENSTVERVLTMKAYGAEVLLSDSGLGIEGSRDIADSLVMDKGYYMLDQFSNDDNWKAHYLHTGPEIWKQTDGKITHFVSAMGTTGTIVGVSKFLKEKNKDIVVIGVQPLAGAKIPGIRKWSEDYVPKIYDPKDIDRVEYVSQEEAMSMTRLLAIKEGVLAGMSSGGAAHVAAGVSEAVDDAIVVSIVCDRGDRYLSSGLF